MHPKIRKKIDRKVDASKIAKKKPSGAKGSPKVANTAPNGSQNHPKIGPKSRLFRVRSKTWFRAPLPHGINGFRGPRRPESEENLIKNRACKQTPSNASFFSVLGPPGRPKGQKRLPKGYPKGSQRVAQGLPKAPQNGGKIDKNHVRAPFWGLGTKMTPR